MRKTVKTVAADLVIRANAAIADGPRGFENAMISMIKALSKEAEPDDLLAVSYRLQALANLAGLTMTLHGKTYKLISEAAFHAAAVCPLRLTGTMTDVKFDRQKFLDLALTFAEPEGNG
jgi:hypothetical protein